MRINFPNNSACMFDVVGKYSGNDAKARRGNVDLCKHSDITLYVDKKSRTIRAVAE